MTLEQIILVDRSAPLTSAWTEAFDGADRVRVVEGDLFDHRADAMVSPANSFGIMDGGIDLAIRDRLGAGVQRAVQSRILERHHGELVVGAAEIVETGSDEWPFLIVAPTMRVPEVVARTLNAYLAFRAILHAVKTHGGGAIRSIVCPGLATGIGAMEPRRCATQMRLAYEQLAAPARIPSFGRIRALHQALRES